MSGEQQRDRETTDAVSDRETTEQRLRDAVGRHFSSGGTGEHVREGHAALDRLCAFIAAKAKVEALREQPCRSLKHGDCISLAETNPALGGDHDMCFRCTPLAAAESTLARLSEEASG